MRQEAAAEALELVVATTALEAETAVPLRMSRTPRPVLVVSQAVAPAATTRLEPCLERAAASTRRLGQTLAPLRVKPTWAGVARRRREGVVATTARQVSGAPPKTSGDVACGSEAGAGRREERRAHPEAVRCPMAAGTQAVRRGVLPQAQPQAVSERRCHIEAYFGRLAVGLGRLVLAALL